MSLYPLSFSVALFTYLLFFNFWRDGVLVRASCWRSRVRLSAVRLSCSDSEQVIHIHVTRQYNYFGSDQKAMML